MLEITVSHCIEIPIRSLPDTLLHAVTQELTFENPAYVNAVRMDLAFYKLSPTLTYYEIDDELLRLPRGYIRRLLQLCTEKSAPYVTIDRRLRCQKVAFRSSIQLRDYQRTAVEQMIKRGQGGIVAPCGAGKTMMMLEAMARIGQPTLWITHTQDLAQQAVDCAVRVLDMEEEEIGRIGGGKKTIGSRLTVALIQSLKRMDLQELAQRFGAIFVDEAHHLAADSFYQVVNQFPALYRFWVSATPDREDGLGGVVTAAGGPVLHEIGQFDVPVMIPLLEVIQTKFSSTQQEYTKIIDDLMQSTERNHLVIQTIAQAMQPDSYGLVLSDRIEHLKLLQAGIRSALPHLTVEMLTGKMKKKDREEVLRRCRNKEVHILLATQLAREGLDITHLNRLFLTMPKRAQGAVQQEVGRIMRPAEGKSEAVVYDFWDIRNPIIKAQFWKRREVYRKLGIAEKRQTKIQ